MYNYEEIEEFSDKFVDAEQEIKINPQFFIHQAIRKAQDVLVTSEYKEGLLKYIALISNAEIIAKAARLTDEDYEKELTKAKEEIEKRKEETTLDKLQNKQDIANVKLRLIIEKITSMQSVKGNIELKD